MAGIKFKEQAGMWQLYITPSNNNEQKLGESIRYQTKEACLRGAEEFKNLLIENKINNPESSFINIEKTEKGLVFHYFDRQGREVFYRHRPYPTRENLKTGILSVYNNCRIIKL